MSAMQYIFDTLDVRLALASAGLAYSTITSHSDGTWSAYVRPPMSKAAALSLLDQVAPTLRFFDVCTVDGGEWWLLRIEARAK